MRAQPWPGILSVVTFFAASSVYGTSLVFFVEDTLQASRSWLSVIFTSSAACAAVGFALTGMLADAIGTRFTIILASLANVLLLNLVGLVPSVEWLVPLFCLGPLGLCSTYALGLSWVSQTAPRARLARWLSLSVAAAQCGIMLGGVTSAGLGQLWRSSLVLSALPALTVGGLVCSREPACRASSAKTADGDTPTALTGGRAQHMRTALCCSLRQPQFGVLAFAAFVQGTYIGSFNVLMPVLLKTVHQLNEPAIARLFLYSGLGAALSHISATPYFSGRRWRHRAVQLFSLVKSFLLVLLGLTGEKSRVVAIVVPVLCFVQTALCLGVTNVMVAIYAQTQNPAALGVLTGLTRSLFALGSMLINAIALPLFDVAGLIAPCLFMSSLFALAAFLMQLFYRVEPPEQSRTANSVPSNGPPTSPTPAS